MARPPRISPFAERPSDDRRALCARARRRSRPAGRTPVTGIVALATALATAGLARGEDSARPEVHPWREICWLPGENVSFAGIQIEGQGALAAAHAAQAERARVALEVNGLRGRVRVQMTAPFETTFTTENLGLSSLSLRAGVTALGLLQVERAGVVRLVGLSGDGRTIDVQAGSLVVRGLPLRCEELAAVPSQRTWLNGGGTHRVNELQRLYVSASPSAASFAVTPGPELLVTAPARARGEWTRIGYGATVEGKAAFSVSGWARKPKLRPGGKGADAMAGAAGTLAGEGFRACAPTLPTAPTDIRLVLLPANATLYESAQGDKTWARLTSPLRALVARYPEGRAALAGLPGWSWPSWKCETAWLDPEVVPWPAEEAAPRASSSSTSSPPRGLGADAATSRPDEPSDPIRAKR